MGKSKTYKTHMKKKTNKMSAAEKLRVTTLHKIITNIKSRKKKKKKTIFLWTST